MARAWRLLLDGAASGPWNMGIDEALLTSACRGAPPTLRFYTWRGPWLSLGYAQRLDAKRAAACARAGLGVVRRATGGRAVLHGGDLTYAVAAPETALPPGLRASYELVAEGLQEALRRIGVDAERRAPGAARPLRSAFDCFAAPAADELCAGGRKLAGSAQRRASGGVLQHGSIRLFPDPAAAREAAGLEAAAATSLRELGFDGSLGALREACIAALGPLLGAGFEPGQLSALERQQAAARGPARNPSPAPPWTPAGISRVLLARR